MAEGAQGAHAGARAELGLGGDANPMMPRLFTVRAARNEMQGVATMALEADDGRALAFRPGQFNMLYAFGIGEAAISISGDPAAPGRLVHTTRNVGEVSAALTRMRPGDMVGVRGPFGTSWPVETERGRDLLFVAGGLGLPPLRPALLEALAARESYRSLGLVYGARSPDGLIFADDLAAWSRDDHLGTWLTVDRAAPGWSGRVGVVTTLLAPALAGKDPAHVSAFVCGPEVMMRFVCQGLLDLGVAPERLWFSMERNMKCGIGLCGHCQWGPHFVCRDGPVFRHDRAGALLRIEEI